MCLDSQTSRRSVLPPIRNGEYHIRTIISKSCGDRTRFCFTLGVRLTARRGRRLWASMEGKMHPGLNRRRTSARMDENLVIPCTSEFRAALIAEAQRADAPSLAEYMRRQLARGSEAGQAHGAAVDASPPPQPVVAA